MQTQFKVVLLVACTVVGAVAAVIFKTSSLITADRSGFLAEVSSKQLAPVRRLVQAKLEMEKAALVQVALRREASGNARAASQSLAEGFDVVSLVFEEGSKGWQAKWTEKQPSAKAAKWPQGYEQTLLSSLPYGKVKDGEVMWIRRADNEEHAVFAILVPVEVQAAGSAAQVEKNNDQSLPDSTTHAPMASARRGVVVGFTTENPLLAVTEDFIGSLHKVFVVDDQGYIASHTNKSFTGSLFSEDQAVKTIIKGGRALGSMAYEDLESQRVEARWERVEHSNLFTVIATPAELAGEMAGRIIQWMLVIGAIALVVAILVAVYVGGRMTASVERVQKFVREWKSGNMQTGFLDTQAKDEIGRLSHALAQLAERLSIAGSVMPQNPVATVNPSAAPAVNVAAKTTAASKNPALAVSYQRLAHGLVAQLKEPIASILGNIQLLRVKGVSPELEGHAVSVEREARQVKAVVDNLLRIAGDENLEMHSVSVASLLDAVLASRERELTVAGIQVVKEFGKAPNMNANGVALQAAFAEVIAQACEAMKNRPIKELRLTVAEKDGKVRVTIADTGVGLDSEGRTHFFDPFFQAYSGGANPGFGLAMSQAVLARHLGDISLASTPGDGTTVSVAFPPSAEQSTEAAPSLLVASSAANVSLPELPVAPGLLELNKEEKKIQAAAQNVVLEKETATAQPPVSTFLAGLAPLADARAIPFPPPPPEEERHEFYLRAEPAAEPVAEPMEAVSNTSTAAQVDIESTADQAGSTGQDAILRMTLDEVGAADMRDSDDGDEFSSVMLGSVEGEVQDELLSVPMLDEDDEVENHQNEVSEEIEDDSPTMVLLRPNQPIATVDGTPQPLTNLPAAGGGVAADAFKVRIRRPKTKG